jgi:spoIIIJ-associated protein
MKKKTIDQIVTETTQDFISRLGFFKAVTAKVVRGEEENSFHVQLETKEPALIIGYHGETLSALQLFLNLHLHSLNDTWMNLTVNVNDYRERREATLRSLADSVVARVIYSGTPHTLPPMPASERRVIHLYLAEHPEVSTSSEGVGRNRGIVISLKV